MYKSYFSLGQYFTTFELKWPNLNGMSRFAEQTENRRISKTNKINLEKMLNGKDTNSATKLAYKVD